MTDDDERKKLRELLREYYDACWEFFREDKQHNREYVVIRRYKDVREKIELAGYTNAACMEADILTPEEQEFINIANEADCNVIMLPVPGTIDSELTVGYITQSPTDNLIPDMKVEVEKTGKDYIIYLQA